MTHEPGAADAKRHTRPRRGGSLGHRRFQPGKWIREASRPPRLDWENLKPNIWSRGDDVDRAGGERRHDDEKGGGKRRAHGHGPPQEKERTKSKKEKEHEEALKKAKEREKEESPGWGEFLFTRHDWKKQARYTPLIAAVFAPLATLLDIPALSQHWYDLYGVPAPDPTASLVLSAVGLALNVTANALLILRFSSQSKWWWRHATTWSLVFWILKTLVALANLILFGILTRNTAGYSYAEGFWCAVVSIIDAGIISVALILHYFVTFRKHEDNNEIRAEGKRFMLSVTFFVAVLGIQSLVFCKIEGWEYLDALYFSVQVALTIGYGDYVPTTTAGKVLIFPFAILTISHLGNEISLILGFIRTRAEERRGRWRKRYEKAMHDEANILRPKANLMEEMALIYQINKRENMMSQIYDLGWSFFCLVVFWAVGAAIFSSIEGWSFGNGVYAVMILSFTIGFGDYVPTKPAAKVVFVVYALMAVPIVTSFAVQTITGLLSTYSRRSAMHDAFLRDRRDHPEAFKPHADYVLRAHETYSDMRKRLLGDQFLSGTAPFYDEDASESGSESQIEQDDQSPAPTNQATGASRPSSLDGESVHNEKHETDEGNEKNAKAGRPKHRRANSTESDGEIVVDLSQKHHPEGGRSLHISQTMPVPKSSSSPPESPSISPDSANQDVDRHGKQQKRSKPPSDPLKLTKAYTHTRDMLFPETDCGEGYNERETKYRDEYQRMKEIMARRKERMKRAGVSAKDHVKGHKHRMVDPVDPEHEHEHDEEEASAQASRSESSEDQEDPDPEEVGTEDKVEPSSQYCPGEGDADDTDNDSDSGNGNGKDKDNDNETAVETPVASSSKSAMERSPTESTEKTATESKPHPRPHRIKEGRRQRERLRKRHGKAPRGVIGVESHVPEVEDESEGSGSDEEYDDDCEWQQLHLDLTKQLMELTVRLEAEARQLIVDSMDTSVARTLLLADRNVQIRDVKAMRGDDVNILKIWRGEREKDQEDNKRRGRGADENSPASRLNQVKRYRNTFAEVLVVGSILQQLKGEEWGQFVRLNEKYHKDRKDRDDAGDANGEELPEPFGRRRMVGDDKSKVEAKAEKFARILTV